MPSILHRRASSNATLIRGPTTAPAVAAAVSNSTIATSNSSTAAIGAANHKPPSVLRYTLILLKARPSRSDLDTISVYAGGRATLSVETAALPTYRESESGFGSVLLLSGETEEGRGETPPPPYEL